MPCRTSALQSLPIGTLCLFVSLNDLDEEAGTVTNVQLTLYISMKVKCSDAVLAKAVTGSLCVNALLCLALHYLGIKLVNAASFFICSFS